MGGGTIRGECRYGRGLDPTPARGCESNALAGRRRVARIDPLAERDAGERAAAGDREDGPGRGRGRLRNAGGLQTRASTGGNGRAGVVAERPGTTGGPGNRAAGER